MACFPCGQRSSTVRKFVSDQKKVGEARTHKDKPRESEHEGSDCDALEDGGGLGEAGDRAFEQLVNPEREGSDDQKHGHLDDDSEYKNDLQAKVPVSVPAQNM